MGRSLSLLGQAPSVRVRLNCNRHRAGRSYGLYHQQCAAKGSYVCENLSYFRRANYQDRWPMSVLGMRKWDWRSWVGEDSKGMSVIRRHPKKTRAVAMLDGREVARLQEIAMPIVYASQDLHMPRNGLRQHRLRLHP